MKYEELVNEIIKNEKRKFNIKKISILVGSCIIGAFALIGLKVCTQYVVDSIDF